MISAEDLRDITQKSNYNTTNMVFINVSRFEMLLDPNFTSQYGIVWYDKDGDRRVTIVSIVDHSGIDIRIISHNVNHYREIVSMDVDCGLGDLFVIDDLVDNDAEIDLRNYLKTKESKEELVTTLGKMLDFISRCEDWRGVDPDDEWRKTYLKHRGLLHKNKGK